jgi:hypothetical protein
VKNTVLTEFGLNTNNTIDLPAVADIIFIQTKNKPAGLPDQTETADFGPGFFFFVVRPKDERRMK